MVRRNILAVIAASVGDCDDRNDFSLGDAICPKSHVGLLYVLSLEPF
jgi:hypothetical protein